MRSQALNSGCNLTSKDEKLAISAAIRSIVGVCKMPPLNSLNREQGFAR